MLYASDDYTPDISYVIASFRTTGGDDSISILQTPSGVLRINHGSASSDGTTVVTGATHIWVDFSNGSGNGTMSLYVDSTGTMPETPEASITTGDNNTAIERFGVWAHRGATNRFDQLLVSGSTIGDVCE